MEVLCSQYNLIETENLVVKTRYIILLHQILN